MMCLRVRSDAVVMNVKNAKALITITAARVTANVALQVISSNPVGLFARNLSIKSYKSYCVTKRGKKRRMKMNRELQDYKLTLLLQGS